MTIKVKAKVWLDKDGQLIFGAGKSAIIKAIAKTGSLNGAAKALNMSYRHVWSAIQSIEKRMGKALLIKTKGGKDGGGAVITEYAKELIKKFDKLDDDITAFVNKQYKEIFDGNI